MTLPCKTEVGDSANRVQSIDLAHANTMLSGGCPFMGKRTLDKALVESSHLSNFLVVRRVERHQAVEVAISNMTHNGAWKFDRRLNEVGLSLADDLCQVREGHANVRHPQTHLMASKLHHCHQKGRQFMKRALIKNIEP